ncbi:MAG: hypothetical protein PHQ40_03590 [Anaerolineaceae bacterium]|nr:hypothetical protein [Anaerolineaceae bacterium]
MKDHVKPLIYEVLEKTVDGGLIVTDGSMMELPIYPHNPYAELARFHCKNDSRGEQASDLMEPFIDLLGNQFTCIGYLGEGYGPTLIWKVDKPKYLG